MITADKRDDHGGNPWLRHFAVYLEPRVLAVLFLGFSSGLPLALTGATLAAWLTDVDIDLTIIGFFALVGTPYGFKFLWAPVIDRLPLPLMSRVFGRRRGWLLTVQMLLGAAIIIMALTDPAHSPWLIAGLAVAVSFLSASQDIVIDAFRIESLDDRQQGAGAAMIIGGYRIAMLVSGAGALILAEYYGWSLSYLAMAALLGVGVVTVLVSREPDDKVEREAEDTLRRQEFSRLVGQGPSLIQEAGQWLYSAVVAPFLEFLTRPGAIAILLFVLLYKFGDALAGTMTTPFILKIGFTKAQLAEIAKVYGFAATMIGVFVGGYLIRALGILKSLWICGILQAISNLMFAVQAWYGDNAMVLIATISFENLAGGMGTAAFVAYLSSLCNVAYTATQYALLTSFMAAGRTFMSSPAGWLVEHVNWAGAWVWLVGTPPPEDVALQVNWIGFFVLTTIAALPGLAMLAWLMRNKLGPADGQVTIAENQR
ncbi:MAG: AmpG family muropeptide MFS transporter [Pseudomonadota bacterium]